MIDCVMMNQRRAPSTLCAETFGKHCHNLIELTAREIAVRPGCTDEVQEFIFIPIPDHYTGLLTRAAVSQTDSHDVMLLGRRPATPSGYVCRARPCDVCCQKLKSFDAPQLTLRADGRLPPKLHSTSRPQAATSG